MENLPLKNPRITKKEKSLIKGALRRVFSRSELRRRAVDAALVKDYSDPSRKRVTRWGRCTACQTLTPLYLLEIDHVDPVQPLGLTLDDMTYDTLIDRIWCKEDNLKAICKPCHKDKSLRENKERRQIKKGFK